MSKTYNGNDKVDNFFAHYGRKGMKRGENIFNPNYKPIGEKAKGPSSQSEAQQRAFEASQRYAADSRRQALLNGERNRRAAYANQQNKNKKIRDDEIFVKDFANGIRDGIKESGSYNEEVYKQHKELWDSLPPSVRGYNISMIRSIVTAKGGSGLLSDDVIKKIGTDNTIWALLSSGAAVAAGRDGYPDIVRHAEAYAAYLNTDEARAAAKQAAEAQTKGAALENKIATNKARAAAPSANVSKEYLNELEYNSKKNSW